MFVLQSGGLTTDSQTGSVYEPVHMPLQRMSLPHEMPAAAVTWQDPVHEPSHVAAHLPSQFSSSIVIEPSEWKHAPLQWPMQFAEQLPLHWQAELAVPSQNELALQF